MEKSVLSTSIAETRHLDSNPRLHACMAMTMCPCGTPQSEQQTRDVSDALVRALTGTSEPADLQLLSTPPQSVREAPPGKTGARCDREEDGLHLPGDEEY